MKTAMHAAARSLQRGAAAVEMGLLIVPLVLFALVGTEGGRALAYYNALLDGTRDASRYLSTQESGNTAAHRIAQCLAVYGNTTCAGDPAVPGLDTNMVRITETADVPSCASAGGACYGTLDIVRVEIQGYTFNSFMVPFFRDNSDNVLSMTFAPLGSTMRQEPTP